MHTYHVVNHIAKPCWGHLQTRIPQSSTPVDQSIASTLSCAWAVQLPTRRSKPVIWRPWISQCKRRHLTLVSAAAQQGTSIHAVQEGRHTLPDGTHLEVLQLMADEVLSSGKPPVVMLHGSGHAAWCYQETFMPYFADRGHDAYAISFRCQGRSDKQRGFKSAGTLASHASDLSHFISTLHQPPVILAHSFSGLIAQRYVLGESNISSRIAGLVLLASAPPAGNGSLVGRTMRRRPLFSIRLTWGFITRSYSRSLPLFKEMFFSHDIPDMDLQRWFKLLQDNISPVQLVDLSHMNKHELPLATPPPGFRTPVLTMVGDQDLVVDVEAARETAQHFGQGEAVELEGIAHDLMLDTRWQTAAAVIHDWLQKL